MKRRFKVWVNEGAFFHEPWLEDKKTNENYKYDDIPADVRKLFAEEIKSGVNFDASDVEMLCDSICHPRDTVPIQTAG